jgi:tetratricopeptide (TPR) repeat protein
MMKKSLNRSLLYALGCVLMSSLFSCSGPAKPEKEMKITTSSDEALQLFLQGRDAWEAYQDELAAVLLDQALEKDTAFALAYFYRATSGGGANVYQDNINKAFSLIDEVSEGEQVFLKIFMYQREGDGKAMNLYADSLLAMFPEDPRVPFMIGFWDLNGDLEADNILIKKAIEIDSTYPMAYAALVDNYSFLEDYDQAEKYAKTYMELLPEKADPLLKMGTLYRQEGKFEQAIETYQKMIEVDPRSNPYIFIGNCYNFMGEYDQARESYMESYDHAQQVNMKLSSIYNYSLSFVFEGDMKNALASMEKYQAEAEDAGITSTAIWGKLFQMAITWAFEDYDTSEKLLVEAKGMLESAELDPVVRQDFERNMNLWKGYLMIGKGDLTAAREFVDAYHAVAIERNMKGEIQSANFYYGLIALKEGDFGGAVSFLEKSGEGYMSWYYLGEALEGTGDIEKARAQYEKLASANLMDISLALVRGKAVKRLEALEGA